jgi:membrane protein
VGSTGQQGGAVLRFLAVIGRSTRESVSLWNRVHGSLLAASVAFYACFCVFPVILILLAGFGFFLQNTGWGQNYEQNMIRYVADQTSPELAQQIQSLLHQVETTSVINGPVGILFLLMTALTLFVNFERCFNIIWGRTDRAEGLISTAVDVLLHRWRGFLMLLAVAVLIFVNFASYFAIELIAKWLGDFDHAQRWWQLIHLLSSLGLNAVLFTFIYRTLPRARVWWSSAIQGGAWAAITWEVGRYVLAWLIISDKYHAFGVVGVFMGLMMWAYYGIYVVLLGATITRTTMELAVQDRRRRLLLESGVPADEVAEMGHESARQRPAYRTNPPYQRTILLDLPPATAAPAPRALAQATHPMANQRRTKHDLPSGQNRRTKAA